MYKLMIADDEALEREGLEMMTRRMLPDMFTYVHAENGRKAIQLAEEERPDFIFMDIKMPGIQGLEAIREIRKRQPEARVVLVTAHDFFAYAKEAVSLGVKEYILKPAKREELLEVLRRLITEKEGERNRRAEELVLKEQLSRLLPLVENELTLMLMTDCVLETDLSYLTGLAGLQWSTGYAMVLAFPFGEAGWEMFRQVRQKLYNSFKTYAKSRLACMVSPLLGNKIAVMVPVPERGAGFTQRVEAVRRGEEFLEYVHNNFGLSPIIGIGPLSEGVHGLRESYRAASLSASAVPSDSLVRIRHSEDMYQPEEQELAAELEQGLLEALRRQQAEEARWRIGQILDSLFAIAQGDMIRCRNEVCAMLLSAARRLPVRVPRELLAELAAAEGEEALRHTAAEQVEKLLAAMSAEREQRQQHVVERAKMYMEQWYKTDVSMEQTAESVNLSPYYFSKVFKQYTGENFTDYLTRLRIGEAKRLLADGELSFKEICYEVGYNDPNYFSRIFKKTTGVTPTEYRHQSAE